LFKMKKQRYAWVTIVPTIWLLMTSLTAGWQKIFHENPKIGFLAQANKFSDGIAQGTLIAPAKSLSDMQTIVMSNQINAGLCAFFMLVAVVMLVSSIRVIRRALNNPLPSVHEAKAVYAEDAKHVS
jgi:carbon starvation protein